MKKLLRSAVVIATAAGVGYVVYKEVLSDEAKQNIKKMVETVKTSYERINEGRISILSATRSAIS